MKSIRLFVVELGICLSASTHLLAGDIVLLGRTAIPGTAVDLSTSADPQENGTPQNRLGGYGSGIAWTGKDNRYVMIPDRGPDDGATSYRCRFHVVEIDPIPDSNSSITFRLIETRFLTNAEGKNFLGGAKYFDAQKPENGLRLDPEGIRVTPKGTLLISDEYGPTVREFDSNGRLLLTLPTPIRYSISSPGTTPEEELPPKNTSGRVTNRGWEGIALSGDGQTIYTILQSPLIQDGGLDKNNKRVGTNVRIMERNINTGKSREFLYPLDDKSYGCSEIEWLSQDRLLVLERDGLPGPQAKAKLIYEIDLSTASDVSSIDSLPSNTIPAGIIAAKKTRYLDLLDPKYGLAHDMFPEKIEGIALGPTRKDGSRVLVITSDNDFKADQPTEIYLFAVK